MRGSCAELARTIHSTEVTENDGFPPVAERVRPYISGGVAREDMALGSKCMRLLETLPVSRTLIHGDFHTGNVFLQKGEALLIDMDRLSVGHPIIEISDLYYFYVVLGEEEPAVVERFMGFSYETARQFFRSFLKHYLQTEDENRLREVTEKASLLCYTRMIHKIRKKGVLSKADQERIGVYVERLTELTGRLDSLAF